MTDDPLPVVAAMVIALRLLVAVVVHRETITQWVTRMRAES